MANKKLNHQVLKNTLPYFVKLDIKKVFLLYICIYICVCVCVCIYIYIYVYIHTEVILSINI